MENNFNIQEIVKNVKTAIDNKNIDYIRNLSDLIPISEIAKIFDLLSTTDQVVFVRLLTTEEAAEVFAYLDSESKNMLIQNFSENKIAELLEEMYTHEIADLLEEVPWNLAAKILKNTNPETRQDVNKILQYSDDKIGSIMSVDIFKLLETLTCAEALKYIRDNKEDFIISHYFYITNDKGNLVGAATLEDIVFSEPLETLANVMFPVRHLNTQDSKETGAQVFSESDMSILPVVNSSNLLIGAVSADEVIDIIQEEATEDMYKMAGISIKEDEASENYLKKSVLSIVKSRFFWLLILMVGSTLSQIIIEQFTSLMQNNNFLLKIGISIIISTIVSIIPVISGSAGNAGSQSATTVTRALSLGQIDRQAFKKVLLKEIGVGSIIGLILMVANFLRLVVYFLATRELLNDQPLSEIVKDSVAIESTLKYNEAILIISFASSFAMFLVIVFSKFLGSSIPLIAWKFGKDPAVMSAPILATMTDATSTFIFFGITIIIFILTVL